MSRNELKHYMDNLKKEYAKLIELNQNPERRYQIRAELNVLLNQLLSKKRVFK